MIDSKDIAFVIQGKIHPEITKKNIYNIRRLFPCSEIILSTYIGEDTQGFYYDKLVLSEDNAYVGGYTSESSSKLNNINRQIQTTIAGLKQATKRYAFKVRTDFIIEGDSFMQYFNMFDKYDKNYKIFNKKILCPIYFSRNPRFISKSYFQYLYHPSDLALFGLTEDLINLFDIPQMLKDDFTYYMHENGVTQCRYVPEQYMWISCLRKNNKNIQFDNLYDITLHGIEETERYFVSNFIFLNWEQFGLRCPRRLKSFFALSMFSCITHVEWKNIYKKYVDGDVIVDTKDRERIALVRKLWVHKLVLKPIANIVVLPFFGKRFKKTRRKLRHGVLCFLEKAFDRI